MTLLIAAAFVVLLFAACVTTFAGETKLIMGFETEEIVAKQGDAWCTLVPRDGGVDYYANFEAGRGESSIWIWKCRTGDATEGEQALVAHIGPGRKQNSFETTPFQQRYYPILREHDEAAVVFSTFQWLAYARGGLGDWKGFDLLWLDVKADTPVKVWLTLEDAAIEPPVARIYEVPAGKWVTLELDLNAAERARSLDLAHIANVYLFAHADAPAEVRVDNVRVVQKDVENPLEVLRDESDMTVPAPKLPARAIVPAVAKDFTPDRSPARLESPRKIAEGSVVPFGWIAAADNGRLLLGVTRGWERPSQAAAVIQSLDGGATWSDLDGPKVRNFDHGTSRGSVIDERGDVVTVSSGPGCAGLGVATPRQHLTKYTFTGAGWERRPGAVILDYDIRHCASAASVVRIPSGRHQGRIWAAWGAVDRFRRLVVHCKFSDDDGLTWGFPGQSALVPNSVVPMPGIGISFNTYAYLQPRIAPFRGHAVVLWQDSRGLLWSRFDGRAWSDAEVVDAQAKAKVAVCENESFRIPGSAVTLGEDQVFVTAWNLGGVHHYDGKSWRRELVEADDAGVVTVCGGREVMLITSGHTEEPPPRVKNIHVTRQAGVLCYRRKADGTWAEPLDLAGGTVTIHQYRQMTGVVTPPSSPENFAPVAFSDGAVVYLVKVPVLAPAAK